MKPIVGHLYYLSGHTAPMYFDGFWFWCVLTNDSPSDPNNPNSKVVKDLGHVDNWTHTMYKPERLNLNPAGK